jgi:transcriptional regulator with XRE-family HTH domain
VLAQLLGRRIATLRKRSGFTQEQFAEAAGYSVEFISLIERGVNSPTIAGIERIAQILKVEPKALFTFDEEERR